MLRSISLPVITFIWDLRRIAEGIISYDARKDNDMRRKFKHWNRHTDRMRIW